MGPNITINSAGVTITSSGVHQTAKGNEPVSGLQHFEFIVGSVSGAFPIFGIANAAAALNAYELGDDNNSLGIFSSNGLVLLGGTTVGSAGFSLTNGDVLGIEVDTGAKNIYFMKGATRSSAFSYAAISGSVFPALSLVSPTSWALAHFTNLGDGLHPLWLNAVQLYLFPNVKAWLRAKMAAFWP